MSNKIKRRIKLDVHNYKSNFELFYEFIVNSTLKVVPEMQCQN